MIHPFLHLIPVSETLRDELRIAFENSEVNSFSLECQPGIAHIGSTFISLDEGNPVTVWMAIDGQLTTQKRWFSRDADGRILEIHREDGAAIILTKENHLVRATYYLQGNKIPNSRVAETLGECPLDFTPEQAMLFNLTFGGK